MPRKLYEPACFFDELLAETLEQDSTFVTHTPDPTYKSFAQSLINEHYPPQSELPLT